jgi:CubicO group peptidase (beta-lactamase class C family)
MPKKATLLVALVFGLAACGSTTAATGSSPSAAPATKAAARSSGSLTTEQQKVAAVSKAAMSKYQLKALIVRVTTDGKNTYTSAFGDSMTGVPATTQMRVRNGFMAYSYLTTILFELIDQKKLSLSDKVSKYLPDLPHADQITIKMLANSTSGYADYVYQPALENGIYTDPFRQWTGAELIKIGTSAPLTFKPGTNFAYAHTNYAILGTILAKVTGQPLSELMTNDIIRPMGLKNTSGSSTPEIPGQVLHTFSSERRPDLKIPANVPFYEETTYWNPSWTTPEGASQTTDITDLTTSIAAIGSGKLLSAESYQQQTGANLVGFGHPAPGCPACRANTAKASFGMGVIRQGPWITGNKFYAGSGAIFGYLPAQKVAIAVIATYLPGAWDSEGNMTDAGPAILKELSQVVAPTAAIP